MKPKTVHYITLFICLINTMANLYLVYFIISTMSKLSNVLIQLQTMWLNLPT